MREPEKRRVPPMFWVLLGLFSASYGALFVVGFGSYFQWEWAQHVASAGLNVLPFVPLILLGTLGNQIPICRILTVCYWVLLAVLGVFLVATVSTLSVINWEMYDQLRAAGQSSQILDAFPPGSLSQVKTIVFLCVAAVAVGLMCYTSTFRQIAARWIPIDADSFVHAVALATVVAMTLGFFVPLLVLRAPPLLALAPHMPKNEEGLVDQYSLLLWMVPVAILAAGFPLVRNFHATLRRLGLVKPTFLQVLFAIFATGFLLALMQILSRGIAMLWQSFNWPQTDEKAFEELLKFAFSTAGAIAVGVTAGVSEELAFRGLLQPRIGILLSNLLFTSIHAYQYHWDGLVSVFVIGLILGRIRERTNTTTSALIHGLYDFVLVLGAVYQVPGFTSQ
ncbi:MAG: CPBP family intramembrane glutamic endopeptidase [Gemmataceae bacterium]